MEERIIGLEFKSRDIINLMGLANSIRLMNNNYRENNDLRFIGLAFGRKDSRDLLKVKVFLAFSSRSNPIDIIKIEVTEEILKRLYSNELIINPKEIIVTFWQEEEGLSIRLGAISRNVSLNNFEFYPETGNFDFALFTKDQIDILTNNFDDIIISGAHVNFGSTGIPEVGRVRINRSREAFTLKAMGKNPKEEENSSRNLESAFYSFMFGLPCPPEWYENQSA